MSNTEPKWKHPFYIFPLDDFKELKEIFKEAVGDKKGHINFSQPKYRFLIFILRFMKKMN